MNSKTVFFSPNLPVEHVYMTVIRRPMSGDLSYKQLQEEIGKRLKELRNTIGHGLSPEDIAIDAASRGLSIGAQTIRQWEAGRGVPTLDKLWVILQYYRVTLGDFFRFTITGDQGRLLADFVHIISDPQRRAAMKQLIDLLRGEAE